MQYDEKNRCKKRNAIRWRARPGRWTDGIYITSAAQYGCVMGGKQIWKEGRTKRVHEIEVKVGFWTGSSTCSNCEVAEEHESTFLCYRGAPPRYWGSSVENKREKAVAAVDMRAEKWPQDLDKREEKEAFQAAARFHRQNSTAWQNNSNAWSKIRTSKWNFCWETRFIVRRSALPAK